MALNEDAAIGSSTAVGLKLGSNGVALLAGTADPDGNTDPWKSAAMGSIYLKYAETDDEAGIWQKVDDDNANDDWVKLWVDKDEESGGRTLECDLTIRGWDERPGDLVGRDAHVGRNGEGDGKGGIPNCHWGGHSQPGDIPGGVDDQLRRRWRDMLCCLSGTRRMGRGQRSNDSSHGGE